MWPPHLIRELDPVKAVSPDLYAASVVAVVLISAVLCIMVCLLLHRFLEKLLPVMTPIMKAPLQFLRKELTSDSALQRKNARLCLGWLLAFAVLVATLVVTYVIGELSDSPRAFVRRALWAMQVCAGLCALCMVASPMMCSSLSAALYVITRVRGGRESPSAKLFDKL